MGDMSYDEWLDAKERFDTKADRDQFEEYQKLLGKDAPKYYNDFQGIKYSDKAAWDDLKRQAHMERVIQKAPCELTTKNFTGYFLKPDATHADDFFNVGYTPDDVRLLKYDIARQFNMDNAIERESNEYSVRNFDIPMMLGVTEKQRFLTGWQIDKGADIPRIITAYRKDEK